MDFFDTVQPGLAAVAGAAGSGCKAARVDANADAASAPFDEDADASAPVLGRAYAETGVMGTTSVGEERSSSPTNRAVGRRGCADENDDEEDDDCDDADDDAPNCMLVAGRCAPVTGKHKTREVCREIRKCRNANSKN